MSFGLYSYIRPSDVQIKYPSLQIFFIESVNFLPTFYLKAHSDIDSHTMNQPALVIVSVRVKRIHKIRFITYRSHYADVWCDVHLHADAWRDKQAEALLVF